MLAAPGFLVAESFNPLFDHKITGAGIYHFQQAENLLPSFWYLTLFAIALVEVHRKIILTWIWKMYTKI